MELRNGGDSSDWFFLAMAHWQLGNKDRGREFYTTAAAWMARFAGNNEELKRFRAEAAALLQLPENLPPSAPKAPSDDIHFWSLFIEEYPKAAWPYFRRADTYASNGQPDKAIADYSQGIELDPKNADAWFHRAQTYDQLGQFAKALDDSNMAIEVNPKWNAGWVQGGLEYIKLGHYDKALDYTNKAIELDRNFWWAWNVRGWAYYTLHQYDKAIADLDRAIELDANSWTLKDLAWVLANCQDPKFRDARKAVELAKKAVELRSKETGPGSSTFWNTLGAAHYRAGNWKEAVAALEKSIELRKSGDSYDWFFLAMAHWQLGQKDDALKCYKQAVEWMEKNKEAVANNPQGTEDLRRFRTEAEELLGIEKPAKAEPELAPPK
jgi:tetratricopeptide (TPR) repeat protein